MAKASIQPVIVGLVLDVFDWAGFGSIPFIGDIIDLLGVAYFWRHLGPASLAGLLELVPLADILPTYTALGVYTYIRGGGK